MNEKIRVIFLDQERHPSGQHLGASMIKTTACKSVLMAGYQVWAPKVAHLSQTN